MLLSTRPSGLCVLFAAGLLACGTDGGEGGGDDSSSGTSSAVTGSSGAPDSATASPTTSETTTEGTTTDTPTTSGVAESGSSGSGSGSGSESGSSSGGRPFPVDCEDGGLPVRVDGGGEYATVSEGVAAVPPGGTLWICPGEFEETAAIQIERDVDIVGAGPDLVSITAATEVDRVFLVRDASVRFEGISIRGAGFGIDVGYVGSQKRTTTMRDIRVSGSRQAGIFMFRGPKVADGLAQAIFEDVVVENVVSEGEPVAIAGVALYEIEAGFIDTIIRDNVTRSGGLEVEDSEVTFEGGQVIRNEALFPNGGGARLVTTNTSRQFTIVDSDWGAGAEQENVPNDMDCGSGANNDVGWLGNAASAVCGTDIDDCCTPQ